MFDLLDSLDLKIGATTSQRLVLALFGTLGRGKSFALNEIVMKGLPTDWGGDPAVPLGHRGPLPSDLSHLKSLTILPTRLRCSSVDPMVQLRTTFKDSSKPAEVSVLGPFSQATIDSLRALIQEQKDAQAVDVFEFEVTAPFPGMLSIEQSVRAQLEEQDRALFVGVEFVDLPGTGDDAFSRQHRQQVLAGCDIICCAPSGDRGAISSSDILDLVAAGALPSYDQRSKLVLFDNLRQERHQLAMTQSCIVMRAAKTEHMKVVIDELLSVSAAEQDNILTGNRIALRDLLSGSPVVHVKSPAEGEALMRKVRDESSSLLFYSQELEERRTSFNEEALTGFQPTDLQLSAILLQELVTRVRYCRMYPLLDDLQKMGALIKRKMSLLIHSPPDPSDRVAHKLTATFNKITEKEKKKKVQHRPLQPILRFSSHRLDQLSLLADIDSLRNKQPVKLLQLLSEPSSIHQLMREIKQIVEDSFTPILEHLDAVVDQCIHEAEVNAVREDTQKGFLQAAVRITLKDRLGVKEFEELLRTALTAALCACVVPRGGKLTKDVAAALELISGEMQDESSESDSDADSDDSSVSSVYDSDSTTEEERKLSSTKSEGSIPAPLLIRLLIHLTLDWARVNQPGYNKSKVRLRLADTALFVQNTYRIQLTELFRQEMAVATSPAAPPFVLATSKDEKAAVPASTVPVTPLVSPADAKQFCDAIDKDIVKKVRLAMRDFNPNFSFEEMDTDSRLTTAKHLPEPKLYTAPKQAGEVVLDIPHFEATFRKTKKYFSLSDVISLLHLPKKICVRKMVEADLEADRGRRKQREDSDRNSQKWAAALVQAAVSLLGLQVAEFKALTQTVLLKVETGHLRVAEDALWFLRSSRLSINLNTLNHAEQFSVHSDFSALQPLIPQWLQAGNDLIIIGRDCKAVHRHADSRASRGPQAVGSHLVKRQPVSYHYSILPVWTW